MSALVRLSPLQTRTAGAAIALLALLLASPVTAQSPTFGGLSESSDEPIDIESDVLVVHDSKKYATFKGNVKAVQGTTTLRASELDVHYVGGRDELGAPGSGPKAENTRAAPPAAGASGGGADSTRITKIEAKGDVVITSEDDQTTTSDWALYDVPTQMVTVGGNVVLTQGQNVLKGDRLVIDLKTGESRFENTGNTTAGGRIRALFMPKEGGGAKSGDGAKSDDDEGPRDAAPAPEPDAAEPEMPAGSAAAGTSAPERAAPGSDMQPWQIVPEYR